MFSGIGAPECAAPWIDWRWSAEIDPFACAVHKARFPDIPNLGDVTEIDPDAVEPVDLVVFGSPCQDFSVAGQRRGMDGARGNLTLAALDLVGRLRPRWLVFENVPGLLSNWSGEPPSDLADGEERQAEQYSDFAAFLGAVRECGYLGCWRVLDAQFAGVPQQRRRIFFVGYLGDWRPAAAVLFEPESLRGDPAPRREAGQRVARPVASCIEGGSGYRNDADRADDLIAAGFNNTGQGWWNNAEVATGLRDMSAGSGSKEATLIAFSCKDQGADAGEIAPTLRAMEFGETWANGGGQLGVAYRTSSNCGAWETGDKTDALTQGTDRTSHLVAFGGNNTAGPVEVATACNAHGGPHGRLDFESETFVAYDILGTPATNAARQTDIHSALRSRMPGASEASTTTVVTHSLRADGFDASEDGTGRGTPLIAIQNATRGQDQNGLGIGGDSMFTLDSASQHAISGGMTVRRLTPRECERLQGFADDFTLVQYRGKPAADGPRYRAIGNSMAIPCIRWILGRIGLTTEKRRH